MSLVNSWRIIGYINSIEDFQRPLSAIFIGYSIVRVKYKIWYVPTFQQLKLQLSSYKIGVETLITNLFRTILTLDFLRHG